MYDMNAADYFRQFGVNAGADVNLADLVPQAQQSINAGALSRIAGYPELTATGAPVRSARGTYWSIPTAQGMRYISPETFTGPGGSGADGASFTSALTNSVQKPWTIPDGNEGYYYAKGANPSQARYSGAGLGLGDEWGGSNAYYNVYDQAPEEAYYKIQKDPGFSLMDFAPLLLAAGPLGSALGAFGAGASALGGAEAAAGGAFDMGIGGVAESMGLNGGLYGAGASGTGGGMWDWLDQIIDSGSFDPGSENMFGFEGGGGGSMMPAAVPETPAQLAEWGMTEVAPGRWELPAMPGRAFDFSQAKSLIQQFMGSGAGGGLGGGRSAGGGILGGIMGDPLGSAFNATPFLLAMAQANKQAGDLNGVLSKINGEGYTKAVLNPYDLQTGLGRTGLEQDLDNRGVTGSSFGYQSLNNYDYMRDLGRGDLASKGLMASAGLEGSLINQRNTNTNLLLGAGLNASGRLFSPQKDPFNLSALLGN